MLYLVHKNIPCLVKERVIIAYYRYCVDQSINNSNNNNDNKTNTATTANTNSNLLLYFDKVCNLWKRLDNNTNNRNKNNNTDFSTLYLPILFERYPQHFVSYVTIAFLIIKKAMVKRM